MKWVRLRNLDRRKNSCESRVFCDSCDSHVSDGGHLWDTVDGQSAVCRSPG